MSRKAQTTAAAESYRASSRPPIFEATRVLGLNDRRVARLLGVSPEAVHQWVNGKYSIPPWRHAAIIFLVGRLIGIFGAAYPPQSRYARRSELARQAAKAWEEAARNELIEDCGGFVPDDVLVRGYELGEKMLRSLEAQ
jgi:hypothetical protein